MTEKYNIFLQRASEFVIDARKQRAPAQGG